jgi:2-methylcitrate dehydratase PrpD
MQENELRISDISAVTTLVHQGAIDVLGPVTNPSTVHQAKFSMGTTLGLIASYGKAGMVEFEDGFAKPEVVAFRNRVEMVLDDEVNTAYPARWIGKVRVQTTDGRTIESRVDEPKGDPGNTLSRAEIETKVKGLARFSNGANTAEMEHLLPRLWSLTAANHVGWLLTGKEG